jgi:hypothetical protein
MLRAKSAAKTARPGRPLRFESLENRQLLAGASIAAPLITSFTCANPGPHKWTFTGKVVDTAEPVAGMKVTLGGVLAEYHLTARVRSDGTFTVSAILPFVEAGWATAQVKDAHNDTSNTADAYVDAPDTVPRHSFEGFGHR